MKKLLLAILILMPLMLNAQKYACVNTEYILANIPDYASAQSTLDKQSAAWQKEIEDKFQEIDRLYKTFQQEAYLLPENLKRKREEELKAKETEARELQTKYFGPGGDLDKKRAELMKPIQDRVYGAIERIAREKNYAFILDKAGSATLLYVSAKYDVSDQILDMLGYKPGAKQGGDDKDGSEASTRRKEVGNPEMRNPGKK
ncbi:MAG: OmpH family outer membrane protein [Bacteroidales bacterium]|nr:OmpH family outer membrane protein [Bacteroidales bacterium]